MNAFSFLLEYEQNGKVFQETALNHVLYDVEYSIKAAKIELSITTKRPIALKKISIAFKKNYDLREVFYANGYQAWTTSREYGISDRQKSVTPLSNLHPKLKAMAATSGDYLFTDYPKKTGAFHAYTYCYLRRGGAVELFGSLSEKNGFTVFRRDMTENLFTIEKDLDGLICDGQYSVFDILRIEGGYDEVFDRYFEAFGVPKLKHASLAGYTSWYNYFQKIDESIILRDLEGMAKVPEANIFQIDDGYETFVGDWLDPNPKKFPNGMAHIAQKIHEKSLNAGLWLAPLNAQKTSRLAKEHPDWLIRDNKSGKPIVGVVAWGGAYGLDIYNSEVRAYLKTVFHTVLNEWGFDMVKLDFLYSQCMQPRLGKTRGTIMCETMEFLRECVGDKLLLGCGVPLGAAFGYVDACRTGCDAGLKYGGEIYNKLTTINAEIISAQNSVVNTVFRRHLNGRAFLGDPDVFFLRDDNLKFTEEQKLLLARINNLFGGVLFVSDDVGAYDEGQLALLREAFTKKDITVLSAEFVTATDIRIVYSENGKNENEKKIEFNLKKGNVTLHPHSQQANRNE
ncbi:MAG: alpha-galactosidase [Clostridiales bacterium]|jgi:alpha-galactosidase|nr:alpha-galactosidase [Clostridiales bacterium]